MLAQAHNELGDVHAHFGNHVAAAQCWKDALDGVTGAYKSLEKWRQLFRCATSAGARSSSTEDTSVRNASRTVRSFHDNGRKADGEENGQPRTRDGEKSAGVNARWMHVLAVCGGARGCLLGAGVIAKLLTSALKSDAHAQREAALMGAEMTSAVFATSVAHPQAPLAFAAYTPEPLSWGHVSPFAGGHVGSVKQLHGALLH